MQLDTKPLIDAINRLIEKADDDLKDSLEAEGYVAASELVKNINKLEDAIDDVLDADSLEFLEKIEAATGVTDFITDIWPGIKDADDLEKALREIFRKQFDDMFREFTYQWVLVEDPSACNRGGGNHKACRSIHSGMVRRTCPDYESEYQRCYGAITVESTGKEMVHR